MTTGFRGFPPEGIAFLRSLARNNDREWFQPRKAIFEETVRAPMIELVSAIHREMIRFAPKYVGEPAKCIYRIYRDTRFAKDKTPYKTFIAASLRRNDLGKERGAGFYLSVSPKEVAVGGGLYQPAPEILALVRPWISDHHAEFRRTFTSRKIRTLMGELYGESMTRVPKGFDPADPAADLLKRKSWFLYAELDPKLSTSPKLVAEFVKRIEAITPFLEFLNRPLAAEQRKRVSSRAFME